MNEKQHHTCVIAYFLGVIIGVMSGGALIYAFYPDITPDIPLPSSRIGEESIRNNSKYLRDLKIDFVVIKYQELYVTGFAGTGSMRPTLTNGTVGIWTKNLTEKDIAVGDIIHFFRDKNIRNETIAHRVIRIGQDKEGWYAKTKGDANGVEDSYVVRKEQVIGVLMGIVY